MLWDIIRDFFVQYVFGGCASNEMMYGGLVGNIGFEYEGELTHDFIYSDVFSFNFGLNSNSDDFIYNSYISLGDWLSTTFTIITLCLICFFFFKLTIYLFKMGANLFKW